MNLAANQELETIHLDLGQRGTAAIAASILSSVSSTKVSRIGFDVRVQLLCDSVEHKGYVQIGAVLASVPFSCLKNILFRLEYEPPFRYLRAESLAAISSAFTVDRIAKLTNLEELPYERRDTVRRITDDCYNINKARWPTLPH